MRGLFLSRARSTKGRQAANKTTALRSGAGIRSHWAMTDRIPPTLYDAVKAKGSLWFEEQQLRVRAGQVMAELKARGDDWQTAWKTHPVAVAYRELLKRAWREPHQPGPDPRYRYHGPKAGDARLNPAIEPAER